jgi:hypothetical protein
MTAVRRRAWWYLLAFAVLLVIFGVTDVLGGVTADPGIPLGLSGLTPAQVEAESATAYRLYDFAARTQGLVLIVMGFLVAAIVWFPYRSASRWSWAAMWILPAWSFAVFVTYATAGVDPDMPPPPPMVSAPILGLLTIAVLLLDRARFVARQDGPADERRDLPAWTVG